MIWGAPPGPSDFSSVLYELDVLPGLKEEALLEYGERLHAARQLPDADPEAIRFEWTGPLEPMLELRLAAAAHVVHHFDIRRPRQLLGDQDFRRLVAAVQDVRARAPFTGLRLSAAGAGSPVYTRLLRDLSQSVGLPADPEDGDLLLRVRPSQVRPSGWDVLIRLTPRPLATRAWRRSSMPGALNSTIAAAMVRLTRPSPRDRFLNLMCGSGTLLAERAAAGRAALLAGVDADGAALALAERNLDRGQCLIQADARALPLAAGSFDVLVTDLPWGNLSGSHAVNLDVYPRALAEAARVAAPGARMVLITHEIRLLERSLSAQTAWRSGRSLSVLQGGQHPRIQVLERT